MKSLRVSAAVLAAASLLALPARSETTSQLPRTVRPTHYDVAVTPDAPGLTFQGKVAIAIDVLEPTASITLNAIDLAFKEVTLSGGPAKTAFAAPKVAVDAAAQTATFTFDKELARGAYRLSIDYTGRIGTQAVGLFALDYATPQGKKRALFTQFENSDARRLLPCWDEPGFKTTFVLEATVPSADMAVSNMPVQKRTDLGQGLSRVSFAPSPKMSTYLLFLAVGDLERATTASGKTEIGVVTKKGAVAQAQFALESSATVLAEYNDYFGTPYPLPKLDNVAAPGRSQFFGAMENWGAIFTFEYALLVDPAISTESDRQGVFKVAAHEISHQWFGDLVTMAWWDDLWLNEGFASWMEGRTTRKLHPEWNSALGEVKGRDRAMSRDALATTHPVVQHVETVEQASQAFDAITYEKGEAVIGMLETYVGAEAWRAGVRSYMKNHAYANTVSDDLWRDVEAAAGKPITAIAHDFTLQPGVPLITVEEGACAAGTQTLTLVQSEFSRDQPDRKPLAWRVPVLVAPLKGGEPVRALVTGGKATVSVPGCGGVLVNAGQTGYFRTLYAPPQFARIASTFAKLPAVDQMGVLSDTWALGRALRQPAADILELAKATPADADPQVWGQVADVFTELDAYHRGDPERRQALRKFAIGRLQPVFARVGWEARPGEPAPVAILRNQLIATLGTFGDPDVVGEARRRYAARDTDPKAVPGPLRKAILGVVARHADAAAWDRLHEAARAETTPLIRENLYFLLAASEDEGLARRALDLALTAEPGATLSAGMIAKVADEHPDLAFDFALAHMAEVNERIDATSRSRYYARLAEQSADPAVIDRLKAYATANLDAKSRRETETAAANIGVRVRIRRDVLPALDTWLAQHAS